MTKLKYVSELNQFVDVYLQKQSEMGELNSRHMDTLDQAFVNGYETALYESTLVKDLVDSAEKFGKCVAMGNRDNIIYASGKMSEALSVYEKAKKEFGVE